MRERMLTEFTQFFGARRAAIPEILQFFRATFAEHLRDLDASLEIFCIRMHLRLVQEVQ